MTTPAPKGGAKGAEFERYICKQLSLWISHNTRDDLFWRSAASGGRATVAARSGKSMRAQLGDLTAVDGDGVPFTNVFVVEMKHQKNISLDSYILKNTGPITGWWQKVSAEADRHDRIPMLIMRQNRFPIVVVTTYGGTDYIRNLRPTATFRKPRGLQVLYRFDDLVEKADPDALFTDRYKNNRRTL